MLSLTIWAVTLAEPTGHSDDDSKAKSGEPSNNLPAEFHSMNEVRDFIQQLKKAKRVRSSRELRIITLDGQNAQVQVGSDSPQITSSSISNRGRQNAIMYRPLGTVVDVRPRIDSEKHIQIQLDYSLNDTAKSNDVAILEEPDGKSQFADVILHRQLKTMVRLQDGGAVVAHCDATTGWADKSGDGQTELIIIGGAIAKAE
jgi:type II secretory pathway component GspD/PulD (secretin)